MNKQVLFVDDDTKLLEGVKRRFESKLDVFTAASGQAALELIGEHQFAVIVSDMRMPVMDGLQFIEKARQLASETVYIMLTGNQDMTTASNAVNQGQVFRFLTKPCPSNELGRAIESGLKQYELVAGQHELMNNTFCGSIKVLTDVLELTHPELISRAEAILRILEGLLGELRLAQHWEYKLAVRLSSIGRIVTNSNWDESHDDTGILDQAQADIAKRLISHIPRLELVGEIVGKYPASQGYIGDPEAGDESFVRVGASLVRASVTMEHFLAQGLTKEKAAREVALLLPNMDEKLKAALKEMQLMEDAAQHELVEQEVKAFDLTENMVLAKHVTTENGSLLLSSGTRLTRVLVEKLRHTSKTNQLGPIWVYDQMVAAT